MTAVVVEKAHDTQALQKHCGARTRPGAKYGTCHRPSGWGTDHAGRGRCKLHGGSTPRTHGRYSQVTSTSLQELLQGHATETDQAALNMRSELDMLRALTVDYLNRYRQNSQALWDWHEDWVARQDGQEGPLRPKPRMVLDIASAAGLLTDITKVVERIENVRAQNAISRKELHRLVDAMSAVVEREVKDEDVVNRIRDGWLTIRPS